MSLRASPPTAESNASSTSVRPTIGQSFSSQRNSLNFLRLALALMVIVSHAIALGGFGSEWIFHTTTLGVVAVYGFFGISGFLIAGSAIHNGTLRYFWQRCLRILPAYWVCLIVTVGFFASVAWLHSKHPMSCSIVACYFSRTNGSPLDYLVHNWWLHMIQPDVGKTAQGVPYPGIWNGSVWSLYFEAGCYVLLALLAMTRLLKRRILVAFLGCGLWLFELISAIVGTSIPNFVAWGFLTLTPVFLAGTLLYLYRDRLPDSGWLALGSIAAFVATLSLPLGEGAYYWSAHATGASIAAPLLAYPLLWLGIHLPFQRVGARNDYSYGVYIYAFPVQQLLAIWGLQRTGYVGYLLLSVVGTGLFAFASWWVVEKRALRLKKVDVLALLRSRRSTLALESSPTPAPALLGNDANREYPHVIDR